jgi:hypothetical protein
MNWRTFGVTPIFQKSEGAPPSRPPAFGLNKNWLLKIDVTPKVNGPYNHRLCSDFIATDLQLKHCSGLPWVAKQKFYPGHRIRII